MLPKFAPLVARHCAAYLELFADEAGELGSYLARRTAAVVAALLALSFTLAMACVWILNAVWDTPWRQAGIIGLMLLFAAAAVAAWITAVRRPVAGWTPFHRLRSEWALDEQLIAELMDAAYQEPTTPTSSRRSTRTADQVKDYAL